MNAKRRLMKCGRVLAGIAMTLSAAAAFAGSASYTYDSLGRLTKVVYSNGVTIVYSYDQTGNRTSTTVTGAPS